MVKPVRNFTKPTVHPSVPWVSITNSRDLAPLAKECICILESSDMFDSVMCRCCCKYIYISYVFACIYIYASVYQRKFR